MTENSNKCRRRDVSNRTTDDLRVADVQDDRRLVRLNNTCQVGRRLAVRMATILRVVLVCGVLENDSSGRHGPAKAMVPDWWSADHQ